MIKKILTLFLLFSFLPINSALSDSKILSPEDYITYISQETLDVLGNKNKSTDEKVENITNIFLSNLAVSEISLFVLGPYRRNLDSVQKTKYINLIKRFISEIYSIRLASFPSGDFSILSSTDNGRSGIIVKTSIQFLNDPNPTKIDWRLIKKQDGNFKIFDVRVIGIWMAQEQRSTFTSFLSKNNGNIDKLMDRLEKLLSK